MKDLPKPIEKLSEEERKRKSCIGRITSHVLTCLTQEFVKRKFEFMLPVIFSQTTDPLWPDLGSSIEKRIEVEIYGKTVRPTSSMIVQKMVACSLLFDKLFTFSPNLRLEKRERATTGIHAYEFTQLDFEVRHASSKEIRILVEDIVCELIKSVGKNLKKELKQLGRENLQIPKKPFRVFDRAELEKKYGKKWEEKMVKSSEEPFWIVNIPREFYDFEDEDGKWDNYDLILPKFGEVLSGGRREFEHKKIVKKMERDGVKKENYKILLGLAKKGKLKPTAGAGIGVERLLCWIVRAKHIGEVQLFPRIPGMVYEL